MLRFFSFIPKCAGIRFISKTFPCLPLDVKIISLLSGLSVSSAQTQRGQARPAALSTTVPLPYMYTWSGYVNFDMWVSISPIFTMGFIRP